jgi:hypothetical protein
MTVSGHARAFAISTMKVSESIVLLPPFHVRRTREISCEAAIWTGLVSS